MNCTEFDNILTDATGHELDGLNAEQQAEFAAHRAACSACQASYETEIALLGALAKMPVPEPSADFADRVLRAAITQNGVQADVQATSRHQRQGFMFGFGSAAVAAMALWVVVGVLPNANVPVNTAADEIVASNATTTANPASDVSKPQMSIALNKKQDIKLAFYSGESLKGAKITIRLPDNVALVGYPGRRQLSWTTNLKKGDNLLRLPVVATQIARGELVADIEYGDQLKTLTLGLETNESSTSTGAFQADGSVG